MCGIVGYIGTRHGARQVLLDGLKSLEYRGYDSAGLVYVQPDLKVYERAVGEVQNLTNLLQPDTSVKSGELEWGIAHTRWATHGKPTEENAHPHKVGDIYIVHNGIIENHKELKDRLREGNKDLEFNSETDTEVLAHMVQMRYRDGASLTKALQETLRDVQGAYAVVAMSEKEGELAMARNGSPIVLGVIESDQGDREFIIASDISAVSKYTNKVIYLEDGDIVSVSDGEYRFATGAHKEPQEVEKQESSSSLEGHEHFMLKEIYEQGTVVRNAQRGRIFVREGKVVLSEIEEMVPAIIQARRLIILGAGTSYNAGLVAEYLIESLVGMPTEVEFASEFKYREGPIDGRDIVLAISQSGETADTLAATRVAKERGALTISIVNTPESTLSREVDACIYNNAGPEVSVASTKAFSSQLTVLVLLAIRLGKQSGKLSDAKAKELLRALESLPDILTDYITDSGDTIKSLAEHYSDYDSMLYIGRGPQAPIALEGALKIKEIAYVQAQGYPAGELKHGPLALVGANTPCIALIPQGVLYKKSLSNIEEVKARGGRVLAITTEANQELEQLVDDTLLVLPVPEELLPLVTVVPLQLFAYYVALAKGLNIDKPRHLAKSVTVE